MREPVHVYLFTVCEYGGGELASCRLVCAEPFADGFERGVNLRLDGETQYLVREELGEADAARGHAILDGWIEAA